MTNENPPIAIPERKYCSSCSRQKPVEGGGLVACANGAKRWKCADCLAKSTRGKKTVPKE
ncbi:MAG: hypothetical protein HZB71_07255 [Betaproteobacteria bacterium]|nr:hypothetical protein [Betaproteobacteria bacterium]